MRHHKREFFDFLTKKIDKLRIAVIGDIMLDSYYFGEVNRISPEAPVPVNRVLREKYNLGGAANVANNLALLNTKVFVGGVIGSDDNKNRVLKLMHDVNIDTSGLCENVERKTITKLRVIGSHQQMLRLDFEDINVLTNQEENYLQQWLQGLLTSGLDGIIISDYAKGTCTANFCQWIITRAKENNIPVLVDPKGFHWEKYQGADFITPNVKEMGEAVAIDLRNEDEKIFVAAYEALNKYNLQNIIVTRSEKGITGVDKNKVWHVEATAREVFDVSGAGDTVAAVLLACIAGKIDLVAATKLANLAAAIVVGKVGTVPINNLELVEAVLLSTGKDRITADKIVTIDQAEATIKIWQKQKRTVVFTNGCFDLLHVGHVDYLESAKALGDYLVIGLNADVSVRRLKGESRPLLDEEARARLLAALGFVDLVVLFTEDTPTELLSILKPDILVKGGDYSPEEVAGREYCQEVKILQFTAGYSTSNIVKKIQSRGVL